MWRYLLCAVVTFASCASDLKRASVDRKPTGQRTSGTEISPDAMPFVSLDDDRPLTLADFMKNEKLDAVLLLFGSRGCAICNEKGKALQEEVIGQHEVFAAFGDRMRFVGVNTDPANQRRVIKRYIRGFPFIELSDPRGATMINNLLPVGEGPQVPFTALVVGDRLVWFYTNKQTYKVSDLADRVYDTLAAEWGEPKDVVPPKPVTKPAEPDPTPTPSSRPTPVPPPVVTGPEWQPEYLVWANPNRFAGMPLLACDGSETQLVSGWERLVVQVVKTCDATCQANEIIMQGACGEGCQAITLTNEDSCSGDRYRGGDLWFETFATHFDWNTQIEEQDFVLTKPELTDALVMSFGNDGVMQWSHRGGLITEHAEQLRRNAPTVDFGPDFSFYGRNITSFAPVRTAADYTIVSAFTMGCGTCMAELSHWSEDDSLLGYCNARPESCQVFALETALPDETPIDEFFAQTKDAMAAEDIQIPLLLDATPYGEDGMGFLNRFFDAYLFTTFGEWDGYFGTVVFDREGKILAGFKSEMPGEVDPVLNFVKQLVETEEE